MDAYRQLRAEEIVSTLERLNARIGERFPGSGLSRVAGQVLAVARENAAQVQALKRSNPWFRGAIWVLLALAAALAVWTAFELASGRRNWIPESGAELIQEVEAALGLVVYLGAALLFLLTLDSRWRRRRALRAIHELRARGPRSACCGGCRPPRLRRAQRNRSPIRSCSGATSTTAANCSR
jgi:hypothetical protein